MNFPAAPRRQRGIATLLIILLLCAAISVTAMGAAYALRGTQQRQMTVHAATSAQGAAWRGVETVRLALTQAGLPTLTGWCNNNTCADGDQVLDKTIGGLATIGVPDARLVRIRRPDPAKDIYLVTAQVTGQAGSGDSLTQSTVEVVYEVGNVTTGGGSTPGSGEPAPLNAVITFNHNLNLSGSITVNKPAGTEYQINVKGDLTTGGNTITGVDTIWSTGSIQISSGSTFGTLAANGDIKFDGSVTATRAVNARGDICISGGANAANAQVRANGSVVANGGVVLGDVSAIGTSQRGSETEKCTNADKPGTDQDGNVFAVDLKGNSSARTVAATGSVRIDSGSITGTEGLRATGHLVDTNWGGTECGQVGLSVSAGNPAVRDCVSTVAGLQVPIAPVSPVNLNQSTFNAYDVEAAAHYVFKINAAGYKIVTVRNIHGVTDGTYFIADYTGPYKDYLCTELAAGSTPTAPTCNTQPSVTPCKGFSPYNKCMDYDAATRQWTLSGTSFAPGIVWFEGNLHLGNGVYQNSFVATGEITTGGSLRVYAVNYAGYNGKRGTTTYAPTGICVNSNFPALYPIDYCGTDGSAFTSPDTVIGNYALLAGSYATNGNYVGGNIVLGASNKIYGSVLAGNSYGSGGSTTIRGSITALSQGSGSHYGAGSTTIDLRDLPTGYEPIIDPCKLNGTCATAPTGTTEFKAAVHWTRYL